MRRILDGCENIEFTCNMKGSFEFQHSIYNKRHQYIGKLAKVLYSSETESGNLRDPRICEFMSD